MIIGDAKKYVICGWVVHFWMLRLGVSGTSLHTEAS